MLGMSYTSCSLKFTSGHRMPFMQKQIIPYFPQEINPFFKKIPGTYRFSFFCPGACQGEIFHKPPEHEKLYEREYYVASCLSLLCKRIVNGGNFSTWVDSCGQLLWRSMWRMWKTMSFQQLLALLPCGWIGGKLCIPLCITPGYGVSPSDYVTVCIQKFPDKKASSVGICRSMPGVGWGSEPPSSDKLCEKPPKPQRLLLFPPGVLISRFGKY